MKTSLLLIGSALALWSCEPNKSANSFQTGLYILNEGAFMGGTATLTHWSDQDSITPDAFFAANARNLGNLGNGLRADGNRIFWGELCGNGVGLRLFIRDCVVAAEPSVPA